MRILYQSTAALVASKNYRNRDCSSAANLLLIIINLITCKVVYSAAFELYHYK